MIEHHIQQEIIDKLSRAASLRFSQLKPKSLEANLFIYHLKQLIKLGYIEKCDEGYRLAPAGLTYVDSLTLTNRKPRKQPKLIAIFALQNSRGEWLLARRKLQPYIGQLMIPSGKQHFGESPEEHIKREINEQIGQEIKLQRCGFADIRIRKNNQLVSHISAHIYRGDYEGELPVETAKFSYERVAKPNVDFLTGTKEILNLLQKGQENFWTSLDLSAD